MGGHEALAELFARASSERRLGPFTLLEPLGSGGFAPVWLAKEVYGASELRTVAIKLFAVDGEGSARHSGTHELQLVRRDQRARILEEARALCRVEHPNVVRFYAIAESDDERVLGLVMEHVRGRSVRVRLDAGHPLDVDTALDVGVAVASALAAVHEVGLVHRDVKPDNVVDALGVYKLIDFGIALSEAPPPASVRESKRVVIDDLPLEIAGTRATGLADRVAASAQSGSLAWAVGTVGYMDPASLAGAPTPAGDLYSLGALLFECLTGELPAAAAARVTGATGLKGEVLDGRSPPPAVAELGRSLPEPLARLVDALLAPDPARRPRSAEAVAWELERIRLEVGGSARALPAEELGPFRGLSRFEERDRDVYFGRTIELAASLELLRTQGLLALVGPSGSGKSSLARAGVLTALRAGKLGKWPARWDTASGSPGGDPRAAVATMMADLADAVSLDDRAAGERLRAATLPLGAPDELVAALSSHVQATGRGVALLFDQLEELVAWAPEAGRAYTAELLARLGERALPGVRVVVAARRDLLDPLLALPSLGRVLTRGTLLVTPMSRATWGEVIEQALAAYGYRLEDERTRRELLADLDEAAEAMPLVQFALSELWSRRDRAHKTIPRAALRAIGGIAGALDMHAEASRSELCRADPALETTVYQVVMALTTPRGTRATVSLDRLRELGSAARVERVVGALEQARLLVCEGDKVTLAHEALLTQWQRLRDWLAAAREDRVLAEELEREAAAWSKDRADERVWRRRRLIAAEDLVQSSPLRLGAAARDFVRAGRRLELRRRLATVLVLATLVCGVAGGIAAYVLALRQEQRATQRALEQADSSAEEAQTSAEQAQQSAKQAQDKEREAVQAKLAANDARAEADRLREQYRSDLEQLQQRVSEAGNDLQKIRDIQEQIAKKRGVELKPAARGFGADGFKHVGCNPGDPLCADLDP